MKIKCPDCGTSYEIKAEALGPEGRSVKCAKCGNRWFVSPKPEKEASLAAGKDVDDAPASSPKEDTEKDEADWAADSEDDSRDDPDSASEASAEEEIGDFKPPPANSDVDTGKFASDLAEDEKPKDPSKADIETLAKRPKITVNPDKFRRNHIGAVLNWIFRRNFRRIGGVVLFGTAVALCALLIFMRNDLVKQSPDLASLFQMIGMDVNLRGLEFRNLRTFTEVEEGKRVLVVEGSIRNLLDTQNTVPAVRLSVRSADMQEVYAWTVEPRTRTLNAFDETRFRTILADPPGAASDLQVRFIDRNQRQVVLE